jgi:hypothetical protein
MKKSLKNLVYRLESKDSSKLGGGFTVFVNVRGGNLTEPTDPAVTNDVCKGYTNPTGCSNRTDCTGATNNIGCHNLVMCFTD